LCISELISPCNKISDVGTDHAYLPIYLVQEGKAKYAYASDINIGPTERAEKNIKEYGLSDKINAYRAPGLYGIDEISPDTIIIAGMGGELIRDILSESEYVKAKIPELILQPMTQQHELRKWLCKNGFNIYREALVNEDNRIYQIICAKYCGKPYKLSDAELIVGKENIINNTPELKELITKNIKALNIAKQGKSSAGINVNREELTIKELEEILRKCK